MFLRNDFNSLYENLFDRGVKLTLFTNGSVLKEDTLELLRKKKPHYIAITLYGWDKHSYTDFTGVDNSYDSVIKNIRRLKENNISIILRTLPIKSIYHNLYKVIELAKTLDEKLQYFTYLTKLNIKDDVNQRLNPKELLDFEQKLIEAFNYKQVGNRFEDTYKSYGALRSSLYINHKGEMSPCSYAIRPIKSILANDFYQTFIELGDELKSLETQNPCSSCDHLSNCLSCFARRQLEEGELNCSKYLESITIKKEKHYNMK